MLRGGYAAIGVPGISPKNPKPTFFCCTTKDVVAFATSSLWVQTATIEMIYLIPEEHNDTYPVITSPSYTVFQEIKDKS